MKIEIYKSGIFIKGWRWRIRAANGKIIAAATESYKNKQDCECNLISIHEVLEEYLNG